MERISEERLRNTRAWAAARPEMSGSAVIVGAIDELIRWRDLENQLRATGQSVKAVLDALDGLGDPKNPTPTDRAQ